MMKKLFVLLLAVIVMSSLALVAVACGDDTDAELDEALEELDDTLDELDALDEELDDALDEADDATDTDDGVLTAAEGQALAEGIVAQYKDAGSPDDKTGFVTDEVTVGGPISNVKDKGTFLIVNIGDDTAAINVYVANEVLDAAGLTLDDLSAWMGQDAQVTGAFTVNDWGSLGEIQITDIAQIALQ